MGANSSIEWTDSTWNPVVGCTRVSEGCRACYAFSLHDKRHKAYRNGKKMPAQYAKPFSEVQIMPDRLDQPLRWRKPRRIFVNSLSDLFHEDVPMRFVDQVWMTMSAAQQHVFQVLTKRPQRMRDYLTDPLYGWRQRLPNVWLGVSIEDQRTADERIPILLQAPAAVRFVSAEPLLGPICFDVPFPPEFTRGVDSLDDCFDALRFDDRNSAQPLGRLDWVIVGGESGPGARPCDIGWIRSIVQQCRAAGTKVFIKQVGSRPVFSDVVFDTDRGIDGQRVTHDLDYIQDKKGGDPSEWPADLRVRELP